MTTIDKAYEDYCADIVIEEDWLRHIAFQNFWVRLTLLDKRRDLARFGLVKESDVLVCRARAAHELIALLGANDDDN